MTGLNSDALNRTIFISDNLPFLKSLDSESVDLVVTDPPFGKTRTFVGALDPPLSANERSAERDLMAGWGVSDADSACELGLEYPDQTGTTAQFSDLWDFRLHVYEDWLESLQSVCPGAWWLIHSARYTHGDSTAAYIAFMTERMLELRRVLKPTGGVYLHCDHEANAYLRQMMDAVFGSANFMNEIAWGYRTGGVSRRYWPRKHDTILFYVKSERRYRHNPLKERVIYERPFFNAQFDEDGRPFADVYVRDIWDEEIKPLINVSKERTGYPTQKPQALARRMIEASSAPGDLVLDCFAGCAYVPVAAEQLGRRWVACDWSPRAWTVVRRQFHKQPDLRVVTEGEFAESEPDEGVQPDLGDTRVIRVRGPNELPERSVPDQAVQMTILRLPAPTFKRRPVESAQVIWDAFVEEWGTACWYCGMEKRHSRRELQLDHIEPNKRDGSNDDCWNRALACIDCNGDKSDILTPRQTIDRAFEAGRIPTRSRRDEQADAFARRREWATERWEEIKPRRLTE